jgi:hypothetical protein
MISSFSFLCHRFSGFVADLVLALVFLLADLLVVVAPAFVVLLDDFVADFVALVVFFAFLLITTVFIGISHPSG